MFRKLIDIIIFLFIFSLYFVSSLMIYDRFRERKLTDYERDIIDKFDEEVKVEEKKEETQETPTTNSSSLHYNNRYTILGKIEIPSIGFKSVIIKENTYSAMSVGVIKTYGSDLNEPGGFVLSGHNFRGKSVFLYNIRTLKNSDKIYITDTNGRKIGYSVYSVERNVSPTETSYMQIYDGLHVTMVTCENGGKSRIVVKAKSEG